MLFNLANLALIGTRFSYDDYQKFYEKTFTPLEVSGEQLLNIPEAVEQSDMEDEAVPADEGGEADESTQQVDDFDFGEDFW